MIKPTIGELLSGVAVSLRERVLPEIPPGTTRRQIQAAIGIIRRVALVWDKTGPYLYADNEDIEQTMGAMLPAIEGVAADEGNARLTGLAAGLQKTLDRTNQPAAAYPSPAALGERNLELQQLLAELQEILHENPSGKSRKRLEIATTMRSLLRRMLARELEISSPPR